MNHTQKHLDEIKGWIEMPDSEHRDLLEKAKDRLQKATTKAMEKDGICLDAGKGWRRMMTKDGIKIVKDL